MRGAERTRKQVGAEVGAEVGMSRRHQRDHFEITVEMGAMERDACVLEQARSRRGDARLLNVAAAAAHGDEACRKRNTSLMLAQRVVQRTMTTSVSRGRSVVRPEAGDSAQSGDTRAVMLMGVSLRWRRVQSSQVFTIGRGGRGGRGGCRGCWGVLLRPSMARCRLERYRVASVPPEQWSDQRGASDVAARGAIVLLRRRRCMRQCIRSRRGCRAWGGRVPGTRARAVVVLQ
jgi:hypothetical protein